MQSHRSAEKGLLRLCALGYFMIPRPRAPIAEDHRQRDQDLHHADNALQDDCEGPSGVICPDSCSTATAMHPVRCEPRKSALATASDCTNPCSCDAPAIAAAVTPYAAQLEGLSGCQLIGAVK